MLEGPKQGRRLPKVLSEKDVDQLLSVAGEGIEDEARPFFWVALAGLYLMAAETTTGLFAIPGPLLLTWTLMKWSGAPTLERKLQKTRPDYVEYIRRTSGFFPLPPKA